MICEYLGDSNVDILYRRKPYNVHQEKALYVRDGSNTQLRPGKVLLLQFVFNYFWQKYFYNPARCSSAFIGLENEV